MSYFPDESRNRYICNHPSLLSIGWMDAPHPIPQGTVAPEDLARLEQLTALGWQPDEAGGIHACTFCFPHPDGGGGEVRYKIGDRNALLGADNFCIPDGDILYIVPDTIVHYIAVHGYKPPNRFLAAMRQVDPTSSAYKARCEELWAKIER